MLTIKLDSPTNHAAWGFLLLWYYLFYYFSVILMVALLSGGILFVYFSIFENEVLRDIEPVKIQIGVALGVLLFLTLVSVCAIFSGLKTFLEYSLIGQNPHTQSMPILLLRCAIFSAVFSLCAIIFAIIVHFKYKYNVIKKLLKFGGKTISFKTHLNNLKLKIKRVGSNYFVKKPKADMEDEFTVKADDINFNEKEACIICMENLNNILLNPCNHFIFCEECFVDFLKKDSHCPMCKVKILKARNMFYDSEKQEYYSTKTIKLNEDIPLDEINNNV